MLAIAFQSLHSSSMRRIRDIVSSLRLGKLLVARTTVLWPRPPQYYNRNDWAGRLSVAGVVINVMEATAAVAGSPWSIHAASSRGA
jgi:predicted dehydrogenase